MFRIAICDDIQYELDNLEKKINSYLSEISFEYEIQKFSTAENLVQAYRSNQFFDLIFLDIYMDGQTGIDAAEELRKYSYSGEIIFVTSSTIHALSAFNVDAIQYLVKPIEEKALRNAIDKVLSIHNPSNPIYIILRSGGTDYKIDVSKIIYCTTNGHYQEIHIENIDDVLIVRSTTTSLFEILGQNYFVLVGKTYILNLNYIKVINNTTAILDNGDVLYLPRNSYQKLKTEYFEFYDLN